MALLNKIVKHLCIIIAIFILINILYINPTYAMLNVGNNVVLHTSLGATILKSAIVIAEIAVAGYFTIKLTITGIQYFIAAGAGSGAEQAELKNKLRNTLILGVLAILALYLFAYATDVLS